MESTAKSKAFLLQGPIGQLTAKLQSSVLSHCSSTRMTLDFGGYMG